MKRLNFSKFQYSFRELSSGASFYAYPNENNLFYARNFAEPDRPVIILMEAFINKDNKSPAEIPKEKGLVKEVKANLLSLPPVRLEWLINEMNKLERNAYHLPLPHKNYPLIYYLP